MVNTGEHPGLWRGRVARRSILRGLAAAPIAAFHAGSAGAASPTVGYIGFNTRAENASVSAAILEGLADKGWVPPHNFRWIDRYAENLLERVEPLAHDLVTQGANLIAVTSAATRGAIAAAAGRVPVVYGFSGDPVAAGFADSLARPRHNATGVSLMQVEINAKRIEILKALVPATRRIALLSHPNHPGEAGEVEVCRRTVASLGIDLLYMPVFGRDDVDQALAEALSARADAVMALPDSVTLPNREHIATWTLARRMPLVSGWAVFAEKGALMTYGPNQHDCYRRVGHFAARVLAGTRPADLPIEQPTRFELVLNVRSAKMLGLTVPDSIIARADTLIE